MTVTDRTNAGQTPAVLGPQQLADRYGVPKSTVYYWRTAGAGPRGIRVGRYVRYRLEDVLAWEQEQADKSTGQRSA